MIRSRCAGLVMAAACVLVGSSAWAADPAASLVAAARAGDVAAVKAALDAGADPNARSGRRRNPPFFSKQGVTPLCAAAAEGHADVVALLLARGADKTRTCGARFLFWGLGDSKARGYTPLLIAAQEGRAAVIRALLQGATQQTALADINGQRAAMCDPAPCMDSVGLIFPTFYIPVGGWRHRNDALETAELYHSTAVVQALVESAGPGAAFVSQEALGPDGSVITSPSPLLWASSLGDADLVRWLLIKGADPEIPDSTGRIALEVALDKGNAAAAVLIKSFMRRDIPKAEAASPSAPVLAPGDLDALIFNGDPYQSSDALNDVVSLEQGGDANAALNRIRQAVATTGLTPGLAKEAAKDGVAAKAAVPEDVRSAAATAQALFQSARDEQGYEAAISTLAKALQAAPWWSEGWRQLSAMYAAADDNATAITCLEVYQYSAPSDADAAATRARIEALRADLIEEQGVSPR